MMKVIASDFLLSRTEKKFKELWKVLVSTEADKVLIRFFERGFFKGIKMHSIRFYGNARFLF